MTKSSKRVHTRKTKKDNSLASPRKQSSRSAGAPALIGGSEGGHVPRLFDVDAGEAIGSKEYERFLSRPGALASGAPAIYVHLPFCASRCLSCDHITNITHDPGVIDAYLDRLEQEFQMVTERVGNSLEASQLYLGGGTPNYLSDPQLLRLADILERHFNFDKATDTMLELSPRRSSAAQLQLLRGLGFRGIKLEVRDLDPEVQRALGRSDSPAVLKDVFANARDAGFDTVSMDLVYGLPSQSVNSIRETVSSILELQPDRLTCYSYSRRPDQFRHQRAIDSPSLPSLADRLIMFNAIVDAMEGSDYVWVGLDSFARRGEPLAVAQEAHQLSHNWMGYNRHGSPNLLGFGASAISEAGGVCVQNHLGNREWAAAIDRGELPVRDGVKLSETGRRHRSAITGLLSNMEQSMEQSGDLAVADGGETLQELERQGFVVLDQDKVSVTPEGRYMLHHLYGNSAQDLRWSSGW